MQDKVMAVSGVDSVGAITYASLTNDISLTTLRELWVLRGFDENLLLSRPTGENILRRALVAVRNGHRTLLRPLEGKNGFALVSETAKDDQLDYDVSGMLRARIDYLESGDLNSARLTITPDSHKQAATIREKFDTLRDTVAASAFGAGWIWRYLAPRCKAVSLREFGGVYFIPRDMMDQWNNWSDTIEVACPGVKIYRIPAVTGPEALEAIMDSMKAEATAAITTINAELMRTGEGTLGKRALKNREEQTRQIRNKVEHYEKLFEVRLDDLRNQLDSLNVELGGALLLLSEDSDQLND